MGLDRADAAPRDHAFRIYVDYPPQLARLVGGTTQSSRGHVFFSLVDAAGHERVLGWYAKCWALGEENVPPEERIAGLKDGFKKVPGLIRSDAHRMWHDYREYRITAEQFRVLDDTVRAASENPPSYTLFGNNCTTFAMKLAEKAGLSPPRQWLGVATPAVTAGSIALGHLWDRLTEGVERAARRIQRLFGGEEAAPAPPARPGAAP